MADKNVLPPMKADRMAEFEPETTYVQLIVDDDISICQSERDYSLWIARDGAVWRVVPDDEI